MEFCACVHYLDDLFLIVGSSCHLLTNNCFRFGKNFYRQKMGVAMGNRLAPPFAILFMHSLETRYLATANKSPALWVRYIDNIFGVWLHDVQSLKQFHYSTNFIPPSSSAWNTQGIHRPYHS